MSNIQLILSVIIIVFIIAFVFKNKIKEEYRMLCKYNIDEIQEQTIISFFKPLTSTERIKIRKEFLEAFEKEQIKLSQSLIAKYFIIYDMYIESEKELIKQELEEGGQNDFVSFSTPCLFQINCTSHTFNKDELLEFGNILDSHFEDTSIQTLIVNLDNEQNTVKINVSTCGDPLDIELEKNFQEFIVDIQEHLFKDKEIKLEVEISNESDEPTIHCIR